jgi:hypothetical protein
MIKLRRRLMLVVVLGCLALFGVSQAFSAIAGTSPATTAGDPFAGYEAPTGPELPLEKIVAIADARSDEAGTPNPPMRAGKGSLEAAMRTIDRSSNLPEQTSPGYRAMLATPVYLVVMQGHFALNDAHVPPGDGIPTGSVLDLVIDAHTGAVIGRALPTPEQQQQNEALPLTGVAARSFIAVHSVTGRIAGRLYVSGGPARAGSGPHPGDHFAVIVTRGSRTVAKTTTTRQGTFSIHIRPGRYGIVGQIGGCKRTRVVVRVGKTARATLYCSLL